MSRREIRERIFKLLFRVEFNSLEDMPEQEALFFEQEDAAQGEDADYISDTKNQYPLLTDEDLLCLCLEKVGFSNQTIALCFGNTDAHVVAQRKYRMKERMKESK